MRELDKKIQDFITKHDLCSKDETILLAVSGGIDSMVLLDLLHRLGFDFAIAHCNFQMRNDQSDLDKQFVQQRAIYYQKQFFTTSFNTKDYAQKNKLGIQESARRLRYSWFSEVMEKEGHKWLAVAHHQDDQIETIFLNMARGAGIFGLQGMRPKRDHVIRPLLFASKEDIVQYAEENRIEYREDSSNRESLYRRNFFRNKLIPQIEEKIPSFKKRMSENILIWQKSARLLQGLLTEQLNQRRKTRGEDIILEVDKIEESLRDLVVYEWLRPYGFNYSQVKQIIEAQQEGHHGRLFYSRKNRITTDRKKLILSSRSEKEQRQMIILKDDKSIGLEDGQIEIVLINNANQDLVDSEYIAYLDAAKISFPLILRKWQAGDRFQPLGMGGKSQKLKKFFSNQKLNHFEKERQHLIISGKDICWVVGKRIDHRYRVERNTKYILKLEWRKN